MQENVNNIMYKYNILPESLPFFRTPRDDTSDLLRYFLYPFGALLIFIFVVLPLFGGSVNPEKLDEYLDLLFKIDHTFWAALGMFISLSLSVLGASFGIFTSGSSIMGAAIRAPHIKTKNLISIIFCEAVAIFGVVGTILISTKLSVFESNITPKTEESFKYYVGFTLFAIGIIVGFGNFICGACIGMLGSSLAIADAADGKIFAKILIVEVLASAFGIFSLIVGVIISINF
eukprot:EC825685.1.p1 GENE.EC825685.1~~EC825685.1.p1  ORF type:complete len:232 (+),score=62.50 EC825685.1:50-745(+)